MLIRSTIVHRHSRREDQHFDWMIDDPAEMGRAAQRGLVTYRLPHGPSDWRRIGTMTGRALPLHRRAYLNMDGHQLTGGRGKVVAMDRGRVVVSLWTASRRVVDVAMGGFAATVELRRLAGGERWRFEVLSGAGSVG